MTEPADVPGGNSACEESKITDSSLWKCKTVGRRSRSGRDADLDDLQQIRRGAGRFVVTEVTGASLDADARARDYIVRAFEEARRTGRPDWQTMTVAVLKNRLLDVTGRSFRERDYGSRTISEFVRRYPDLLALDDSTVPPRVSLRSANVKEPVTTSVDNERIRPDLWRAIIDYQSGRTYIWDEQLEEAIAVPSGEETDQHRVMPTLSVDEEDGWRHEFTDGVAHLIQDSPKAEEQTRRWLEERLGTRFLPASLRTLWNQELKRRVVSRLTSWFSSQGLLVPADLLQARSINREQSVGIDTLRQLVLRCVSVMTEDELRQINLPPSAVIRAYGTAVPGKGLGELK